MQYLDHFEAVLFDLDGVLTATSKIHAACWKKMFDDFLQQRASRSGDPFIPFDIDHDYKLYVDGKLRDEGVHSFLESRGIELPYGSLEDPPSQETVCGLSNLKFEMVHRVLESEGVSAFEGSVALVRSLRRNNIKMAVVSSSKSCKVVLESAGIKDLFDEIVDGEVATQLKLPGKPAPDTYLKAAELLGIAPERAVVVEDAISGVQAGSKGGFGLVIGVAREDNAAILREQGADIVVADLGELLI
jgi:beta-phosphoglucomutase family hydrolase